MAEKVSEYDVLSETVLWLFKEGYQLVQISPAIRQDLDAGEQRKLIEEKLASIGLTLSGVSWNSQGPDIVAKNEKRIWKVECKGLGEGKQSTLRNNFDRALASVVSYYDDSENNELHLALAIPYNQDYNWQIINRVRKPLRMRLNLWILLYFSQARIIVPFSPDSEISDQSILVSFGEAMLKKRQSEQIT
ncbi:MAG TPA: hypothetical protein VNN20_10005 [Thermodesulfobacteriota bacterium]|nr:hypothetical protein [Thermodesulfobacteriota bacterium]